MVPLPAGTLVDVFERQVEQSPGAIAATDDHGGRLTYRELNRRANQLARRLVAMGVRSNGLVGLRMERSVEMLVALLAVLKSGGAYVPLDPNFPKPRLDLMVADANLEFVLSEIPPLPEERDGNLPSRPGPADLAYVIYTSGSTGLPKGVSVPHGALLNVLTSMAIEPGIASHDVLLAVTTLSFDIAGLELFLPLTRGARVHIASREVASDGLRLGRALEETGATVMQATPATWRLLLAAGWDGSPRLTVLCGGEALSSALAGDLLARGASVWNLYGPTETTIWSTAARVDGGVSIGRPIANTQAYILDARLQPVPMGVIGEICIGGMGVARGYLHRPGETSEKFVPDPFGSDAGARLYRTGDLGVYRADGSIECLGRTDFQVKVRGFRIEVGEVERALCAHPDVAEAAVVVEEDGAGDRSLAAYLVFGRDRGPDAALLRAHLKQTLPDHMVPARYVALRALPLTPNRKVDRRALLALGGEGQDVRSPVATPPRDEDEHAIAALWRDVLNVDDIDVNQNFFEIGGQSLKATRLMFKIQRHLGVRLSLIDIFQHPTVASQAALARGNAKQYSPIVAPMTDEERELLRD